jgi:hypothetical protein
VAALRPDSNSLEKESLQETRVITALTNFIYGPVLGYLPSGALGPRNALFLREETFDLLNESFRVDWLADIAVEAGAKHSVSIIDHRHRRHCQGWEVVQRFVLFEVFQYTVVVALW